MYSKAKMLQNKLVNGWHIHLVSWHNYFAVHFFAPNGHLTSVKFSTLSQAQALFNFACKMLAKNSGGAYIINSQLNLFQ